jgi:hypothetical protein
MQKQKQQPQNDSKDQRKPYAKPELAKHGNVETVTQIAVGGPSGPIQIDE